MNTRLKRATLREVMLVSVVVLLPALLAPFGEADYHQFREVNVHFLLLASSLLYIALYLTVMRSTGCPMREFGLIRFAWRDMKHGMLTAAVLVASATLLSLQGFKFSVPQIAGPLPLWFFAALVGSVAAAYAEELYFRSYLLIRLTHAGISRRNAAIFSITLFAFCHLHQGWVAIILAAVLGSILTYLFLRLRSIHAVVVAHSLYNLYALMVNVA